MYKENTQKVGGVRSEEVYDVARDRQLLVWAAGKQTHSLDRWPLSQRNDAANSSQQTRLEET